MWYNRVMKKSGNKLYIFSLILSFVCGFLMHYSVSNYQVVKRPQPAPVIGF